MKHIIITIQAEKDHLVKIKLNNSDSKNQEDWQYVNHTNYCIV